MTVLRLALFTSSMVAPALALAATDAPTALPTGLSVAAGQATVSQSNAAMVVTETSGKAILNWSSFNIGAASSVTFVQPSASAVVLNRVQSAAPSHIDGALRANGQIVLINPNGVVFGAGATVDVGGIIASALDIANADFLRGDLRFSRTGAGGSVINEGTIRAVEGGYVALLGSQLANRGMIEAKFGAVAMAAGDRVTMTLAGNRFVGVSVDPAAVRSQIDQGGAIVASDGRVWLSARAENSLLSGAINASGSIEANSLTANGGAIILDATGPITLASARLSANGATGGGMIKVGGLDAASTRIGEGSLLDASAILSGTGGSIETSGRALNVGVATIRIAGAGGAAGSWLLDPFDLTIDQTAAATISAALGAGGVTILTSASTSMGAGLVNPSGSGDITIASPIAWTADTALTLDAYHGVTIDAAITAGGAASGLIFSTNHGGSGGRLTVNAPVTIPATGAVTINGTTYTLINSVSGLQAIPATGHYALVGSVNLGGVNGFAPLSSSGFTGTLEGLGNTITGLSIAASTVPNVGLFGVIGVGGLVENLTLTGATIGQGAATGATATGTGGVGILAGESDGAIYNVSSAGSVTAGSNNQGSGALPSYGGGLVGINTGTIDHGASSATVRGSVIGSIIGNINGGLAGVNNGGQISNSHASGAVTGGPSSPGGPVINGGGNAGGLVGSNQDNDNTGASAIITNSYATGTVTGGSGSSGAFLGGGGAAGGLAGANAGTIDSSYATGTVIGGADLVALMGGYAGGLVGQNTDTITNSYATGAVTGGAGRSNKGGAAGGLVGVNGSVITNSYATGLVAGGLGGTIRARAGGLVGDSNANPANVTGNYWDVSTTGRATDFYSTGVTGLTTVQWLTQGPDVPGRASGWDLTAIWLQGYPYPVLRALPYIRVNASAAGTYGGTLAIDRGGITATDQSGTSALGRIDTSGIRLIGGSAATVTTLTGLGGAGLTLSGASGYQIVYAPISATIDPAMLTFSVANAGSTYGTLATLGAATLNGFVNGDASSSVAGTVGISDGLNPVTLAANTPAGRYSELISALTGPKAGNYVIASSGNAAGTLTIDPLAVALTGSRVYDGSSVITGTALRATNLVGGDSLPLGGSAALAGGAAGSQAIASAGGLILSNNNYTAIGATGAVTIEPLAVLLTGSRIYDGSTDIVGTALSARNLVAGDLLSISGRASVAGKDSGPQAITSTTDLTLSNANYTLTGASGSVDITPLAIVLSGSRIYDGSTNIVGAALSARNLVAGDILSISGRAGLASKDSGPQAITSTTDLILSNNNYTANGATGAVTIDPLAVLLTGSRIYDGSTNIAGPALSARNLVAGDILSISGRASVAGKDSGPQAITSTTDLTLSNANYTLTGASGSVDIIPLAIVLSGSRIYDGSTTIAGTSLRASGLIGGDSLTLSGSAGLAGKSVGAQAITSFDGLTLSNPNYSLSGARGVATISPLIVALTGSRAFDGSTTMIGSSLRADNLIAGDDLVFGGSATLAARDVGAKAIISTDGLTLSNPNYTLAGASGSAVITPRTLTITAIAANILSGASLPIFGVRYNGLVGGDTADLVTGLRVTTRATVQSPPGAYAIVARGATASNYDLVYVDGVLTIGIGANTLTGQVLASASRFNPTLAPSGGSSHVSEAPMNEDDLLMLPNPDGSIGTAVLVVCLHPIGNSKALAKPCHGL